MHRFYLPPDQWSPAPALTGDEARHLSQVLRTQPGETITLFDGCGRRASARVISVRRDCVPLEILEILPSPVPTPAITLAQAIPKGKNMDLVVQKSVELGVAHIQPLVTRYTVVQPGEGKAGKWQRTALEACKQCGMDSLPKVAEPLPLLAWLPLQQALPGLKLIASLAPGALPMKEVLRSFPSTTAVTLLVGPEGDFSEEETTAALAAGFHAITLGPIVLRVETATLFCLSALRYEFS